MLIYARRRHCRRRRNFLFYWLSQLDSRIHTRWIFIASIADEPAHIQLIDMRATNPLSVFIISSAFTCSVPHIQNCIGATRTTKYTVLNMSPSVHMITMVMLMPCVDLLLKFRRNCGAPEWKKWNEKLEDYAIVYFGSFFVLLTSYTWTWYTMETWWTTTRINAIHSNIVIVRVHGNTTNGGMIVTGLYHAVGIVVRVHLPSYVVCCQIP